MEAVTRARVNDDLSVLVVLLQQFTQAPAILGLRILIGILMSLATSNPVTGPEAP